MTLLHVDVGNPKLSNRIIHVSLPSGWTCKQHAYECLTTADPKSGKITDGPFTKFRCYAATQEARNKHIRKHRWHNFGLLSTQSSVDDVADLIYKSIKPTHDKYMYQHNQRPIVRAHVGGEFYSERYFLAWLEVAKLLQPTWFYAYTKALNWWVKYRDIIPSNFELNASRGGLHDKQIDIFGLKEARVVYSLDEAKTLNLEIDHDDSHAYTRGPSFALLLHGTQPAGSDASRSLQLLKQSGFNGYGKTSQAFIRNQQKSCSCLL